MKLLLVDDDPDQLHLRVLTLERAGHQICFAQDEPMAVRLIDEQKPDLAVIDLRFPTEADGLRLIRSLRTLDPNLRIVVLTGADTRHLESAPERALIEKILLKGGGSKKLADYLAGAAGSVGAEGPRRCLS